MDESDLCIEIPLLKSSGVKFTIVHYMKTRALL